MKKLLWLGLVLAVAPASAAETYKCTVNGKVLYTNQARGAAAKCEELFTRKLPVGDTALPVADVAVKDEKKTEAKSKQELTQADKRLESKLKQATDGEEKKKAEEAENRKKITAQNCQTAKANVEALKVGRVARINEKGEKYFLDEATLASELEQANKEVEKWCGQQ